MIRQLTEDYAQVPVTDAEMAMLDYAVALTRAPWSIEEAHIAGLRRAGFSDAAILDINQITGYFNYVNRLASGLGVKLEDYWEEAERVEE